MLLEIEPNELCIAFVIVMKRHEALAKRNIDNYEELQRQIGAVVHLRFDEHFTRRTKLIFTDSLFSMDLNLSWFVKKCGIVLFAIPKINANTSKSFWLLIIF